MSLLCQSSIVNSRNSRETPSVIFFWYQNHLKSEKITEFCTKQTHMEFTAVFQEWNKRIQKKRRFLWHTLSPSVFVCEWVCVLACVWVCVWVWVCGSFSVCVLVCVWERKDELLHDIHTIDMEMDVGRIQTPCLVEVRGANHRVSQTSDDWHNNRENNRENDQCMLAIRLTVRTSSGIDSKSLAFAHVQKGQLEGVSSWGFYQLWMAFRPSQ